MCLISWLRSKFKIGNVKDGIEQIKSRKYFERYITKNKITLLLLVGGFNAKDIEYILEEI